MHNSFFDKLVCYKLNFILSKYTGIDLRKCLNFIDCILMFFLHAVFLAFNATSAPEIKTDVIMIQTQNILI